MNNLPEIRDIYVPDSVSFLPLAYGWWIVLAIIIFSFLFFKLFLWITRTSKKYYALSQLKKINTSFPVVAAVQMSDLLRRICNLKFKSASSLYGKEWIDFLNNHSTKKISGDVANLLIYAPFMNQNNASYDEKTVVELKTFCHHWIGANL